MPGWVLGLTFITLGGLVGSVGALSQPWQSEPWVWLLVGMGLHTLGVLLVVGTLWTATAETQQHVARMETRDW